MSGTVHFIAVTVGPIAATFSILAGSSALELARTRLKFDTFRLSLDGTVTIALMHRKLIGSRRIASGA